MKLWKQTFHDSDDYIKIVFGNYFNPDYVETHIVDGQLVAALLGVPYVFIKNNKKIKALYLCGLSTDINYRGRGIMSSLIENINNRAAQNGFDITFLIPADPGLSRYYYDRGYVNAIFKTDLRFTSNHEFIEPIRLPNDENHHKRKTYESRPFYISDYYEMDDASKCAALEYVHSHESDSDVFVMLHSVADMVAAIKENEISGGLTLVLRDNVDNNVGGFAVCLPMDGEVAVKYLIADNETKGKRLLQGVRDRFPDMSILLSMFPAQVEKLSDAFWQPVNASFLPEAPAVPAFATALRSYDASNRARPYGMVRILNASEILKCALSPRSDAEFSILDCVIQDQIVVLIDVPEGKYAVYERKPSPNDVKWKELLAKGYVPLSLSQLSEILFSPPGGAKMLSDVFGLPVLSLNMALLLD